MNRVFVLVRTVVVAAAVVAAPAGCASSTGLMSIKPATPSPARTVPAPAPGATYGGVGMVVEMVGGVPTVQSVVAAGPAAEASVTGGDAIVAIDGQSTSGLALAEVVERLRGPAGSRVTLDLSRGGATRAVGMTRRILKAPPAEAAPPQTAPPATEPRALESNAPPAPTDEKK